jgi:hypothetical protein
MIVCEDDRREDNVENESLNELTSNGGRYCLVWLSNVAGGAAGRPSAPLA